MKSVNKFFQIFATHAASAVGSPWAFVIAVGTILVWAALGARFGYSDTWQLVINTSTTIVTFLMVFLIQYTQNRESTAIQLKLDELIKVMKGARAELIDLEEVSDEELERLKVEFRKLHANIEKHQQRRQSPS